MNIQPTNGIVIIRALINDVGARFTPYQLSLVPFLNLLFGRIGAGGKDYKEHSHIIDQTATDFSIQFSTDDLRVETPDGQVTYQHTLQASIKGKCLARNVEKMCGLLVDSLTSPDYTEHVYNTLAQYSGGLQSAVEENSAWYAMLDAQSRLPNYAHGKQQNSVHGLPHVQSTTALFKQIALDLQEFQDLQQKEQGENGEISTENGESAGTSEQDASSASKPNTPQKQSPHMMRLANDIAETMRCLILGHVSNQFTHTHVNTTAPQSNQSFGSVGNANYYGPTQFPSQTQDDSSTPSVNPDQLPLDINNIDYAKHQHDPVYPNPHVKIPQQSPLTFPFGFDRILVT